MSSNIHTLSSINRYTPSQTAIPPQRPRIMRLSDLPSQNSIEEQCLETIRARDEVIAETRATIKCAHEALDQMDIIQNNNITRLDRLIAGSEQMSEKLNQYAEEQHKLAFARKSAKAEREHNIKEQMRLQNELFKAYDDRRRIREELAQAIEEEEEEERQQLALSAQYVFSEDDSDHSITHLLEADHIDQSTLQMVQAWEKEDREYIQSLTSGVLPDDVRERLAQCQNKGAALLIVLRHLKAESQKSYLTRYIESLESLVRAIGQFLQKSVNRVKQHQWLRKMLL